MRGRGKEGIREKEEGKGTRGGVEEGEGKREGREGGGRERKRKGKGEDGMTMVLCVL